MVVVTTLKPKVLDHKVPPGARFSTDAKRESQYHKALAFELCDTGPLILACRAHAGGARSHRAATLKTFVIQDP